MAVNAGQRHVPDTAGNRALDEYYESLWKEAKDADRKNTDADPGDKGA
jgi:hypothetical protein